MDEWRRALREARERLGLSRVEAARLSGVSMNTVMSYELGRRRPLRHHLGAVLTVLPRTLKAMVTRLRAIRAAVRLVPG